MTTSTRTVAALVVAVLVLAAGALAVVRLTQPASCNGIDRDLGGCDNPTSYTGTDCAGVAKEFGTQLDDRIKDVLAGPDVVNSESRGVRINHMWTGAITVANQHLRTNRISCDGASFMATAIAQFGRELKAGVGPTMFVGGQATYEQWLAEVADVVTRIIDSPAAS